MVNGTGNLKHRISARLTPILANLSKEASMVRPLVATFFIGLTAGVAPFLFMQLLPAMLNPEVANLSPNYWAIILTGVLIGVITAIVFATKFDQTEPRDIFLYALGVPAVLIATTTNISAEFKANRKVAEVREQASAAILLPAPEPEVTDQEPKELSPPSSDSAIVRPVAVRWTNASVSLNRADGGQADTSYFVVIGEYGSAAQAWEDYSTLQMLGLRTEIYVPKSLGVYQLGAGSYILAYSRHASEADAQRTFELLRINDPQLSVRILKYIAPRQ